MRLWFFARSRCHWVSGYLRRLQLSGQGLERCGREPATLHIIRAYGANPRPRVLPRCITDVLQSPESPRVQIAIPRRPASHKTTTATALRTKTSTFAASKRPA
jgi:hypothetical protein